MTSPLPGYGAGLTDDLILGHIAWYTITKPQLTRDQVFDLVTELGLDANVIPSHPRAGDAFKRACRYSERNGLPVPYSENTANFMIRSVAQTATEVERHIMLEIVDPNGRRLEYHKAAELKFDRGSSVLSVAAKSINDDMDSLTKETLEMFSEELAYAQRYIEAQVIRRMVRQQLENMHAILARARGSVYFVPKKFNEKLGALETFVGQCGVGSALYMIPLVDDTKQQAMIANAFEEGVHEQATQIIAELQQHIDTEKPMTVNAWNNYRSKFNSLSEKSDGYGDLIDLEMSKAQLELEVLETHLNDFLMSGMIKTKGDVENIA